MSIQTDMEKLKAAFSKTLGRIMPTSRWPIRSHAVGRYVYPFLASAILSMHQECQDRGIGTEEIATTCNPKRIWRILHHIARALLFYGAEPEHIRQVLMWFLDVIRKAKAGDPFNSDGTNTIYTPQQVRLAFEQIHPCSSTDFSVEMHKFAGILWSYCESLYFSQHGAGSEIHGLYEVAPHSGKLLIRDYFNLQPVDLWPDGVLADVRAVKMFALYSRRVDLGFSEYGTIVKHKGVLARELLGYRLEVDGSSIVELHELRSHVSHFASVLLAQNRRVNTASKTWLAKKMAEIMWYQVKPISERVGHDWRPPDQLYRVLETEVDDAHDLNEPISSSDFQALMEVLSRP